MKCLPLILCLAFGVGVADAQKSLETTNKITDSNQTAEAQLQLSTSIVQERYSVEAGSRLLRLTLDLTYSNTGKQPILLDKHSSMVYRKLLSRSLKAASERKYHYDATVSYISTRAMQAAGVRLDSAPAKEAFITLKPGESYSLKQEIILDLYDGTKDTKENLHPGTHFLQLRVATWYYFADPNIYREKWRNEGYLWSKDMTSEPMPLKVEKIPTYVN